MSAAQERVFKYPAEDECLVRRLGSGVIAAWAALPQDARDRILQEARTAWDREFHVSKLGDRLESIIRRRQT
jgi:hypothetical protein